MSMNKMMTRAMKSKKKRNETYPWTPCFSGVWRVQADRSGTDMRYRGVFRAYGFMDWHEKEPPILRASLLL